MNGKSDDKGLKSGQKGVEMIRTMDPATMELAKIPGVSGFFSGHALVNRERVLRGLIALKRSAFLDQVCRDQAQKLAKMDRLAHLVNTFQDLKAYLKSDFVGENVQCGPSIFAMHVETVRAEDSAFRNIVQQHFREFGMGTALSADGKLYMVQLFRGIPSEEEIKIPNQSTKTKTEPRSLSILKRVRRWKKQMLRWTVRSEKNRSGKKLLDSRMSAASSETVTNDMGTESGTINSILT